MAIAGLVLSGISAATPMQGGISAQMDAAEQAKLLSVIGEIEASDRRRAGRKLIAEQQVAFAGSGVDIQTGSPLDVLGDTVAEIELDALRAKFARQTQGFATAQRGQQAQTQGASAGLGTILGGVSRFASSRGR